MSNLDNFEKGLVVLATLFLSFMIMGIVSTVRHHNKFEEACIAADGIPYQPEGPDLCLRKDAAIDIKVE